MYSHEKMVQATELFLEAIGHPNWREDPNTKETPQRVAKMNKIMFEGYHQDPKVFLKTFPSNHGDMVLVKNITAMSYCSHHLCPFYGKLAIAYIPTKKVLGLSKIVRFARCHLKKLQLQENLVADIADTLMEQLEPQGVMVHSSMTHTCMTIRGVRSHGATTVVTAVRGLFKEDAKARNEFMENLRHQDDVYSY